MVLASKFDYSATILETHPLSWVFLVLDLHNIFLLLLEFKLFYLYLYWLCWPVNCGVFRFHMLTYTWGLQRRLNIRLKKLSHRGIIVETWLGDEGVTLILTFSVLVESLTFMYKQVFLISSFIKIASKVSFIPKYYCLPWPPILLPREDWRFSRNKSTLTQPIFMPMVAIWQNMVKLWRQVPKKS